MKMLPKDKILKYHKMQIDRFGGLHGLRDENVLDSALGSAFQTFDGKDLHETTIDKIASICHHLIANHAFVDGNKRIGVQVMLMLLDINHFKIRFNQTELVNLGLGIAAGNYKQPNIKEWIKKHLI